MPKIVKHEQKRKLIAEAAWKIIEEEGIDKASIRKVANAAGMSSGALRYYFSTQDEMLLFIMDYFFEGGKKRSEQNEWSENPLEAVEEVLLEILPMDDVKRVETSVWWNFVFRSLTSKKLQEKKEEMTNGIYELMKSMIEMLVAAGVAAKTTNVHLESIRLSALIEGLSVHALLRPDVFTKEKVKEVIRHHLDSLVGENE